MLATALLHCYLLNNTMLLEIRVMVKLPTQIVAVEVVLDVFCEVSRSKSNYLLTMEKEEKEKITDTLLYST